LLDLGPGEHRPVLERLDVSPDAVAGGLVREITARRADGARFPTDLALGAMELPDGRHLVAMIRDISDRKRAEQLKDEFVSTVSHELRTPLTSIAGSLGLLSGGAAGPLPPKAERLTEIAHANCERLIRLINDILDIQKIESGNLRFDKAPVSLAQLVSRSVEDLRGYGDGLGVRMTLDLRSDPVILADSDRMIQVITNLLSNAIKFSPTGETVELVLERKGSNGRLSIRDHGPGVPEAFRDQIFSKFAQADSTDTRQKGGTGLGLAISKEIVERHGGRVSFESWAGRGATFQVDLPVLAAGLQRPSVARKGPPMGEVA
jgi:signal transduction histidine kinase